MDGGLEIMKDSLSTEREIANGEARDSGRTASGVERRRHIRHRLGQPIQIWLEDGRAYPAMAFEMSESGMSAATTNHLRVGQKLDLSPVAKYRVSAIVRRRTGSMYGFEFVDLTEKQQKGIHDLCKDLPLFRSMLDI
jgi:PilZ domain